MELTSLNFELISIQFLTFDENPANFSKLVEAEFSKCFIGELTATEMSDCLSKKCS